MKIPMIMLVAGAAIALTAPLANAAATKKLSTAPAHKVVKHGKTGHHGKTTKPSGKLGTTTSSKPVTPRPPLYIYVPGYSGPALTPDPIDECMNNGVDCTDAQLCEYWGENCSTGVAPATDPTTASSGDQTSGSSGQSGDTQPATTTSTAEAQSDSSVPAASSGDAQSASDMATDDSSDDC